MDGTLKERVDSIVRGQVIGVQTEIQSFNFFFGIQLGILVLRYTGNSFSALRYTWTGEWKGGRFKSGSFLYHKYKRGIKETVSSS